MSAINADRSEETVANANVDDCPKLRHLVNHLESLRAPAPLDELHRLLDPLDLTRHDIAPFVRFSPDAYTRNRVAASGLFELLVVCWAPSQVSHIHDHTGSACAFRVIEGAGIETTFDLKHRRFVQPRSAERLDTGVVCASEDSDIHQVCNPSQSQGLITLHIYTPPLQHMNTYELDPHARDDASRIDDLVQAAAADNA